MDNRPIGFFDSGLGGLTCIPALQQLLPEERIIYFGDTARTPYGSKTPETITKFSRQICDWLVTRDVKMIVIACNTVSATCLDILRADHPDIPIVGIIDPIADKIVRETNELTYIGVIGTKATIGSRAYEGLILPRNGNVRLYTKACPLFVPLIEEGFVEDEMMRLAIKRYLDTFVAENHLSKLVLGCTHYPLLAPTIRELYPHVELLNPSEEVINWVKDILTDNNMLAQNSELEHQCFASDLSDNFVWMINKVFNDAGAVHVKFKRLED